MTDYGTEVKLVAITALPVGSPIPFLKRPEPDGESLIEWAGRICYSNEDKLGTNPEWIQQRIKDGHESILEHASATFFIKCSRVVTHELVRHRLASYSQRSQRYVKENEPRYIIPPEFNDDARFAAFMTNCWSLYFEYLKEGVRPEIARYVLPNACETQIVTTMNFRELRHFIKLRTGKRALPEMQEVAGKVRDICKEIAPEVFKDLL